MSHTRNRFLSALALAAGLAGFGSAHADDSEIYFLPGATGSGDPLVLFYMEYTPNLASTICTGVTSANLNTSTAAASSCPAVWPIRNYLASIDYTDGKIDLFELVRGALKRVLIGLGGVKVGLVMPHNDRGCTTGGYTADGKNCSQGGYILQGATAITAPTSTFNPDTATTAEIDAELNTHAGKKTLFAKLNAIPSPQGNLSHPNQNKEIYFEIFRYLTGQGIYNGHNGGQDFYTYSNDGKTGAFNLGEYIDVLPANYRYTCASGYSCPNPPTTDTAGTARFTYTGNSSNGKLNGDFYPTVDGTTYASTAPLKWDTAIEDGEKYKSPLTAACSKVFVINVVDGGGNAANAADADIAKPLGSGGMNLSVSANDPGYEQMVSWLYTHDLADGTFGEAGNQLGIQNVTSFYIAKQTQQVDAAASKGGTNYAVPLGADAATVVVAINKIFNQVLSVSTTFVAASIPVNVFNRSSVLDNAYLALFQVDKDKKPFWVGNLKKLKLRTIDVCLKFDATTGTCIENQPTLTLVDALTPTVSAIANDGRIIKDAITYWTQTNGYDLTSNIDPAIETSGRDGRSVNRGGAGQKIPNLITSAGAQGVMNWSNATAGRKLYTSTSTLTTGAVNLLDINWANIDSIWPFLYDKNDTTYKAFWPTTYNAAGTITAMTGVWSSDKLLFTQNPTVVTTSTATTFASGDSGTTTSKLTYKFTVEDAAANVFAYLRGFDVQDGDTDGVRWESRRWLMGDPLHSRPRPINYGARTGYSTTNPDIRIMVGGNDGFMRMIRNTNTDGSESGAEVWAFMPRASMKIQKPLLDNVPGSNPLHPIGADGPPSDYIYDANSDGTIDPATDKVWVFFGLRRGGRGYYALDVSNPDSPKLMWTISNATTGFSELGYTFAQPTVRKLKWGSYTSARPVVIFSGGYDPNKDYTGTETVGTNDSMGRAIYVVDAETGTLVWKAAYDAADTVLKMMTDSIPSEVSTYDADGDGNIDRLYVGDTGGQIWRADLLGTDVTQWKMTRLLNVGRHYINDLANDRRFFFAPDVVNSRDAGGVFVGLVIGSGNREHPLQITTTDWLYMYKDRQLGAMPSGFTALTPSNLQDVTDNCVQEYSLACSSTFSLNNGWKLKFEMQGEKSLSPPLTVRGTIYFNSYLPSTSSHTTSSCEPKEGEGFAYEISLADARAVTNYDPNNTVKDADGKIITELQKSDRRVKLSSGGIPAESVYVCYDSYCGVLRPDLKAGKTIGKGRWRTYWYEKQK